MLSYTERPARAGRVGTIAQPHALTFACKLTCDAHHRIVNEQRVRGRLTLASHLSPQPQVRIVEYLHKEKKTCEPNIGTIALCGLATAHIMVAVGSPSYDSIARVV